MNETAPAWRIVVDLPDQSCVDFFEEAIADGNAVVTAMEIDNGPRWRLTTHSASEPDRAALEMRVAVAAASRSMEPPELNIEVVPAVDWVAEYQARTKPVTIGGFFVFPSHFDGAVPEGLTGIKLDAGLAFGTGEHESTSGCLRALEDLKQGNQTVRRALDMGCGSAILAIAMSCLWPSAAIVAVDNDPISVRTAIENVSDNRCAAAVRVSESDGYNSSIVETSGPYDLIAANILAGPLIAMAPATAASLAQGGTAVLSGILANQAVEVLDAYEKAGFALVDRLDANNWATLILTQSS